MEEGRHTALSSCSAVWRAAALTSSVALILSRSPEASILAVVSPKQMLEKCQSIYRPRLRSPVQRSNQSCEVRALANLQKIALTPSLSVLHALKLRAKETLFPPCACLAVREHVKVDFDEVEEVRLTISREFGCCKGVSQFLSRVGAQWWVSLQPSRGINLACCRDARARDALC